MNEVQVCKRCIMSSASDPNIRFDAQGNCNYCNDALRVEPQLYFPGPKGEQKLAEMIATLKAETKDKPFDCIMGISGGLDSAYLAYLGTVKWGLRIAAVHIDDGYDTEVSKSNIQKLCKKCGIDMHTITPDAKQFNELSRAYMLAGVPNLAVPQDNVLFSCLYQYAMENDLQYFLSGGNFSLECILQQGNTFDPYDRVNIEDINRRFGRGPIDKLPLFSYRDRARMTKKLHVVEYRPLNYIDYNRTRAIKELADFCDFQYYGSKHLENYFTAFLQLYWMPKKFGVDKRTSHLSSMIVSGQMTRDEALEEMKKPLYDEQWMANIIEMVKHNFGFSDEEFKAVMAAPTHQHADYKTDWQYEWFGLKIPRAGMRVLSGISNARYRTSLRVRKALGLKYNE